MYKYIGKWFINEMEHWDKDFIDLVAPGHITFKRNGRGIFQFGAVNGNMDCRMEKCGNVKRIEFSWAGFDECDPAFGRGWAMIEDNELHGKIYFHLGDDSWFKATKSK